MNTDFAADRAVAVRANEKKGADTVDNRKYQNRKLNSVNTPVQYNTHKH